MKRWLLPLFALPALALAAEEVSSPGAPHAAEHGWVSLVAGSAAQAGAEVRAQFTGFRESSFPSQGWTVEADGSLHGRGGNDLISKASYGDFELEAEWRTSPGGNSGIFYRIRPMTGQPIYENAFECQVFMPENMAKCPPVYRPGALYNLYGCESATVAKPVGQWNKLHIVVRGDHVVHELNGVRVVDCLLHSPDYAKRLAHSKFAKVPGYGLQHQGPIGLQSDGGEVWYRNVRIREI